MLELSAKQKKHISKIILSKRKEFYGYPGGTRDLAMCIGVSPQLVSMWAHNKRVPGHKELLLLSELFEMDFRELCDLDTKKKSSARSLEKGARYPVTTSEINGNLLAICNLTSEIVKRQRQMLAGKRNSKKHEQWLERIRYYVDTI